MRFNSKIEVEFMSKTVTVNISGLRSIYVEGNDEILFHIVTELILMQC